jgi:hypothetical protein
VEEGTGVGSDQGYPGYPRLGACPSSWALAVGGFAAEAGITGETPAPRGVWFAMAVLRGGASWHSIQSGLVRPHSKEGRRVSVGVGTRGVVAALRAVGSCSCRKENRG